MHRRWTERSWRCPPEGSGAWPGLPRLAYGTVRERCSGARTSTLPSMRRRSSERCAASAPARRVPPVPRSGDRSKMPPEMLFMNRLQFGFYSVLARLDVEVDYAAVERTFLGA